MKKKVFIFMLGILFLGINAYAAGDLRFYAPQMADILDEVMSQPSTNFDQNFQSAIEGIIEKAMKTTNANQLQYLLGDLSLYLQIANISSQKSMYHLTVNINCSTARFPLCT